MLDIDSNRVEIDKIDNEIIQLLKKRVTYVKNIQEWKEKNNQSVYMPNREAEIYEKLKQYSDKNLQHKYLKNIFKEIMSCTIAIEKPNITIGYLGPLGSFTHQASIEKFGNSINLQPISNINEVFYKVQSNEIEYGVVPLENSLEGVVNETLDKLIEYKLHIYSEIKIPIQHTLVSFEKDYSKIQKIYTHKQAFYQCKKWIESNIKNFEWIETTSTSQAIQHLVTSKEKNACAIGSETAATYYNVPVVARNIAINSENFTRFIVISKRLAQRSALSRTSVIFPLSDNPGSLYNILRVINNAKINMTCIESRPKKDYLWSYIFYIELEGDFRSKKVKKTLKEIQKKTQYIKILGSYPFSA